MGNIETILSTLATGDSGDVLLEKEWLKRALEVFRVFQRKQRDYGSANISIGGVYGVVVRMADKMSRLINLMNSGHSPENESLRDTVIDLADYGIILLLLMDGKWKNVTTEEAWKLIKKG